MKSIHHEVLEARFRDQTEPELKGVTNDLKSFVLEAADHELLGINPKRIARLRSLSPMPTLKAFLHLTKAGVFDLNWSVHCPHCKGPAAHASTLAELHEKGHCALCEKDFETGFDQNVELSFRINPSVATLSNLDEFAAALASFEFEPGIKVELEPGESHFLTMNLSAGNYGIVLVGGRQFVNLPVSQGGTAGKVPQQVQLSFGNGEPSVRAVPLREGETEITLANNGKAPAEFLIAKILSPDWTDAALVSSLQEFRDLFSKEMLSPSESFSIQNLSIVFTDLKSSTEMYERLGDSKAFYLVKEHFKIMERVVRKFNGGIVKTIGDAVMAVFNTPGQALGAARGVIEAFEDYNVENKNQNQIIVKIGVHLGPCIAVTLNERLDYFGTSVNIAARVQGLSDGRDIMVSERVFLEAQAPAMFENSRWSWEKFETSLKGLKNTYTVYKGFLQAPGETPRTGT